MSEESSNAEHLEHYLSDPDNVNIYRSLQDNKIFDPLEFFKLFHELLDLIEANKVVSAVERLNELGLSDGLKYYFAYHLLQRYHPFLPELSAPIKAPSSLFLLQQEYDHLEKRLGASDAVDVVLFRDAKSSDERARNAVASHRMSVEIIEKMMREALAKADREKAIGMRAREAERERIEQTLIQEIRNAAASATGSPQRNPEFTTNRQVLAVYYLLKHLEVKNVGKTVQAQFIEFLTGKNYKKIYDSVREVDDVIFIKGGEDAKYVREWFEKLGLKRIVADIDALIDKKSEKL